MKAGGNPPQSPARRPVVEESGRGASKQRLAARRVAAPPAEYPDSPTLMYLCRAPSSQPGRDVLGSGAAHQKTSAARPRTKPCGQRRRMKQRADVPRPRCVPGRQNSTRPGAPLCAATDPSRPQWRPGRPKYSTSQPAAWPQDGSSSTSRPQHYSGQHGQDAKVQTKPHSRTLAVNVKDSKKFAQPLVLLDLPRCN